MIESIMYFGIGFLLAALIGLVVTPLIHGRAVRLTMRRLEGALPRSIAEIEADKDQLRAEFAMSTRRLEMIIEQLKSKTTSQLAELSRKRDAINSLKIERDAQEAEINALKTRIKAPFLPKNWSTAEMVRAPRHSSPNPLPNHHHDEGYFVPHPPRQWLLSPAVTRFLIVAMISFGATVTCLTLLAFLL